MVLKERPERVIFTTGCFDILHPGHVKLLKFVHNFGGYIVVAIDSDERIAETKGTSRPVNTQENRKKVLEALRYVDEVIIFSNEAELELIVKKIQPDVWVLSEECKDKEIIAKKYARRMEINERPPKKKLSTTNIIKKIKANS